MSKLVISPSQQELNQYAGGGTGYEDSEEFWMQKIANIFKVRWSAQGTGIPCVVVNEGSWQANAAKSNALGATEHVALHSNAGGGSGAEVWYRTGSAKGKLLAESLYGTVSKATNVADRGVKSSTVYGELNNTKAPAVIVEYLFHDRVTEAAEIRSSVAEFAEAIVIGMCRYYGKAYKPVGVITPAPVGLPVYGEKVFGGGVVIPVYRFYKAANDKHFYTASRSEAEALYSQKTTWKYEGIAWWVPKV